MRCRIDGKTVYLPRTDEQRAATKARKKAEKEAHRERVWAKYPATVRYRKRAFKGGKAKKSGAKLPRLGLQ